MLDKPLIEQGIQQHTVWTMGMDWKTREPVFCQLAVILTERALVFYATVHKTVIISLATAYLPLKPPSKKIGNEKSDHNRFDQKQYTDTYQVILFRSVCTILNCLETSYVKWDSNPNMSAS